MNPAPDLTAAITTEIARAIRTLGGNPDTIDLTDSWQVNRFLESLGADIYLMCTIGSWKDTMSDEDVLRDLREWLRGGEQALRPEPSFARIREE